ncbi:hypothetical protein Smic_00380 [Streptomyces microflavus]|uniref:Uncharacterized protein n=1 Tax=Streptomyces microflavus TaxID=1919 RepID=A0A7J0CG90_STRMI|nr:hypothetical protein Smic_00380 [Streptomyces microflavus]
MRAALTDDLRPDGGGERFGVGQRAVVQLVVGGTGEGVQQRHGRGDHVLGQGGGQVVAEGVRVGGVPPSFTGTA